MTFRVVLVDDHPVVRSGLRAVLSAFADLDVVGEAPDAETALSLITELRPDVVLTDLRLGSGADGSQLTVWLQSLDPVPAVVLLTTYDHDSDIVRAVEAGAAGYLLKDTAPETIAHAVAEAAAGHTVLDPAMASRVLRTLREPRPDLSTREVEVMQQVAAGASNKQIARALFVTEATVKTHLVHIFAKLGAESRTAAVARARELRLLPD